jgi:hypothetical protein
MGSFFLDAGSNELRLMINTIPAQAPSSIAYEGTTQDALVSGIKELSYASAGGRREKRGSFAPSHPSKVHCLFKDPKTVTELRWIRVEGIPSKKVATFSDAIFAAANTLHEELMDAQQEIRWLHCVQATIGGKAYAPIPSDEVCFPLDLQVIYGRGDVSISRDIVGACNGQSMEVQELLPPSLAVGLFGLAALECNKNVIVLDFGYRCCEFTVFSNGIPIQVASIALGAKHLIQDLCFRDKNAVFDDIMAHHHLDLSPGSPQVSALIDRVAEIIVMLKHKLAKSAPFICDADVLLFGCGAKISGLPALLKRGLGKPVQLLDYKSVCEFFPRNVQDSVSYDELPLLAYYWTKVHSGICDRLSPHPRYASTKAPSIRRWLRELSF